MFKEDSKKFILGAVLWTILVLVYSFTDHLPKDNQKVEHEDYCTIEQIITTENASNKSYIIITAIVHHIYNPQKWFNYEQGEWITEHSYHIECPVKRTVYGVFILDVEKVKREEREAILPELFKVRLSLKENE